MNPGTLAEMHAWGPVDGTGARHEKGDYVIVTITPKETGVPARFRVSRLGAELLLKSLQESIGGR